MRLLLLGGRIMPLMGRWGTPVGEPGGETIMSPTSVSFVTGRGLEGVSGYLDR